MGRLMKRCKVQVAKCRAIVLCVLLFGFCGVGEAKEVVLIYTGNTQGFLEVCGCSDNQLGGVGRRAALLRDLRHKHPHAILVDAGGMIVGDTAIDQLRCAVHLDAMQVMDYDVAHVDAGAFQFGTDFLEAMRDTAGVDFVNANVYAAGDRFAPAFRIVERGDVRVGFVGVGGALPVQDAHEMGMSKKAPGGVEIEVRDAVQAVRDAIGKMNDVDLVVVLSDLNRDDEVALVEVVKQIDVVIGTRSNGHVTPAHGALLLGTEPQGKAVGYAVLDVVDQAVVKHRVLSAFVTETIGEDPKVKELVDGFYRRVSESPEMQMKGTPRFVGYDLEKQVVAGHNGYVGAQTCAGCHSAEHTDWQVTPHASAFQRLLQQQKHVQPDCVPCHTTGFGFETGFRIGPDHESLTNVQCEVCHGPGGQHVRRPEKRNIRRTPTPDLCQQCHDADQTPDFEQHFPEMLAEITHHGQGQKKPTLQTALETGDGGKPLVELFVMADCPYGKRAEEALVPMLQKLGDQVDLQLHFIADEVGVDDVVAPSTQVRRAPGCSGTATGTGRFRSLHGDAEIEESIRQLVIEKLYPDQLWDYILRRNEQTADWRDLVVKLGMDVGQIDAMVQGDVGAALFSNNIRRANLLGIHASPTVLVNGQEVEAFYDSVALVQAICATDSNLEVCKDLPECRSDADCAVPGKVGVCVHANTPQAKCEVQDPIPFQVQVLNDSTCVVCETYPFVRSTLALFPGVSFETVDINSLDGQRLKDRYGLDRVPSFVLDAAFEKTVRFDRFKRTVSRVGDGFVPDMRMTGVAKVFEGEDVQGLDGFIDLAHPRSVALTERLLRWMRDVNAKDRLRLHFVGQGTGDRLLRQAFLKDSHRAWDALLAYAWGQKQRRSDLSVEVCLEQAGFDVSEFGALDDLMLAQGLEKMRRLGGRRDLVPFVVLDGQVVISGAGLARVETVFYQMHPELAKKDRNVGRE